MGPNGSGKSNVTDAVLWAMGEQSPLAVRGQSMQDVIFGGGRGQQARHAAEVEIVIEADDCELGLLRALDPAAPGSVRARASTGSTARAAGSWTSSRRCRTPAWARRSHSVVSQGRVEAIVTSKPRDRRLLIEEAAGLGKHRKRRRRAQLKLERTQDNLDRALDVEREARSRLRPLKRQAEAAELHERLERQTLEARWTLARDDVRERGAALGEAEEAAGRRARRARRGRQGARGGRRAARAGRAGPRAAAPSSARLLSGRAYAARSAGERVSTAPRARA